MNTITDKDNASSFITKMNGNFRGIGSQLVISDSAEDVIRKVNENFRAMSAEQTAVFPIGTILKEAIGSFGAGEDIGGVSIDDFIEYGINGTDRFIKLLHFSDPHGTTSAISKCNDILNDQYVVVTGDLNNYGVYTDINAGLKNQLSMVDEGKLMLVPGNHDVYEVQYNTGAISQAASTSFIKSYMGDSVVYGDTGGVGAYWYKDFVVNARSKVRVIGLDQYEIDNVRKVSGAYSFFTMYSQEQVSWLIARLRELSANDFFIIMTHEPPIQDRTRPNPYATSLVSSDNLFVSEGLTFFGNKGGEPSLNLLPRLIQAYMDKGEANFSYNNKGGDTSSPDIIVNEDFGDIQPATFLCYICGHQHCDIGCYLPDESGEDDGGNWQNQLMLCITAADRSVDYSSDDDLGGKSSSLVPANPSTERYRINAIDFDFAKKTIRVTRIGDMNTAGGRVRDTITFPFKKGGAS